MKTYSLSPALLILVAGSLTAACTSAAPNDSESPKLDDCTLAADCATGGSSSGSSSSTGGATNAGTGSGGTSSSGGASASSGGAVATGGANTSGGANPTGGSGGEADLSDCDAASLVWKTGKKTNYTSYPEPGSEECVVYNGCEWAGWFAGCEEQQTPEWVASHNIVALFPGFNDFKQHDICIRSGDKTMIVTVYDTCGDSDCSGCCTANKGDADALIDLESATNERWGLPDGQLMWADLGPSKTPGCK